MYLVSFQFLSVNYPVVVGELTNCQQLHQREQSSDCQLQPSSRLVSFSWIAVQCCDMAVQLLT